LDCLLSRYTGFNHWKRAQSRMTTRIDRNDLANRIPELFAQVRAGEEVTIWENGEMVARLVPASPVAALSKQPINAAAAFAGRLGGVCREDIPIDLATNDEAYFAEIMAANQPSQQ
jgi:prevent-host-death family protein